MAHKITNEDILNINRAYLKCKTYAGAARETGFSAGTVKKYVVKDFVDPAALEIKKFSSVIRPIEQIEMVWDLLTDDEQDEIEELWREIAI